MYKEVLLLRYKALLLPSVTLSLGCSRWHYQAVANAFQGNRDASQNIARIGAQASLEA
jgi:hypothetical protein